MEELSDCESRHHHEVAVSILVPVRNEASHVRSLLSAICSQDYAHIIEILMLDGMSTDGTREIIREYQQADSRVLLIDNLAGIVTSGMNIGFSLARGDVIIRMDAHADYAIDYVSQCVEILHQTGAGNVGGPAIPASDGSLIGETIKALHESPFGIGAAKFRQPGAEGWVDTLWPGAYRREALEAAGMYYVQELTRSEDIELNSRVRAAGWGIYLSPLIKARYYPRKSLVGLCRQNFGNGMAIADTIRSGREGVSLRHLIPFVFLMSLVLSTVLSVTVPGGKWLLLALGFSYLGADLLFATRAAMKNGLRLFPLLIIAFPMLHLSYGLGSLWGFVRKR
ncbi:MAG: glycosyltransferase family 2 protein [Armatimonadetes bacterium]|nr:glycosyltransferase family 2 protein [Armatimonadota bacterium]